ncbi:MAG: universal stress protein [Pirellulales bacterium]
MNTSSCHFQNILIATDFSECAGEALKTAVALASKLGAKLTLAHVVRDLPGTFATFDYGTGWQVTPDELERWQNEVRAEAGWTLATSSICQSLFGPISPYSQSRNSGTTFSSVSSMTVNLRSVRLVSLSTRPPFFL